MAKLLLSFMLILLVSSCSKKQEVVSIDDLLADKNSFVGKEIILRACLASSRHAFVLSSCVNSDAFLGIKADEIIKNSKEWDDLRIHAYGGWNSRAVQKPFSVVAGSLAHNSSESSYIFVVSDVLETGRTGK